MKPKPTAVAQATKPRRMFAAEPCYDPYHKVTFLPLATKRLPLYNEQTVLVVPLDQPSVEALVEKMAARYHNRNESTGVDRLHWNDLATTYAEVFREYARADLAAIGIKTTAGSPTATGARKGRK